MGMFTEKCDNCKEYDQYLKMKEILSELKKYGLFFNQLIELHGLNGKLLKQKIDEVMK